MNNIKHTDTALICRVGMFAAVTAVLSQITIPVPGGVPVTLQTFGAAFAGFFLGKKQGALSMVIYMLTGAAGVPVFAGFKGGPAVLGGTTGGFIWGFIALAFMCGAGAESKNTAAAVFMGVSGLLVCHLCGAAQFAVIKGGGLLSSIALVSLPYLLKDILSVAAACFAASTVSKRMGLHGRSRK